MRLSLINNGGSSSARRRGGMTLVELLVVIVLVTTLVATAIPVISPGGESRRLREASRNVNAYLQGAQARAIQTGRPFGVALRRLSADTRRAEDSAKCFRMDYVEVPPTYSGLSENSVCRIGLFQQINGIRQLGLQLISYGSEVTSNVDQLPPGFDTDLVPDLFFRPGDTLEVAGRRYVLVLPGQIPGFDPRNRFGGRLPIAALGNDPDAITTEYFVTGGLGSQSQIGFVFLIQAANDEIPDLTFLYDSEGNEIAPPESLTSGSSTTNDLDQPRWTAAMPYRIFRQPEPAAGEPYELPAGVAIDLQASVIGDTGITQLYEPSVDYDEANQQFRDNPLRTDPVLVLFSPSGGIHRLHGQVAGATNARPPQQVTGTLALCVGRNELIPAQPFGEAADPVTQASQANPISLADRALDNLSETEQLELANQYNWLNLESRWVIVGGQTGSVETIEGVAPEGLDQVQQASTTAQIGAVLENVSNRRRAGAN